MQLQEQTTGREEMGAGVPEAGQEPCSMRGWEGKEQSQQ